MQRLICPAPNESEYQHTNHATAYAFPTFSRTNGGGKFAFHELPSPSPPGAVSKNVCYPDK